MRGNREAPEIDWIGLDARRLLSIEHGEISPADLAQIVASQVDSSGAFVWMGLATGQGEFQEPTADIYLIQRPNTELTDGMKERIADIVDLFDFLAISLESQIELDLHLIRREDYSPEQLLQRLTRGNAAGTKIIQHRYLSFSELQ